MQDDRWKAYCRENLIIEPGGDGVLDGLSFSVKDVFAIKGHRNAAGSPDWLRTHEAAARTAPAVEALLNAGARLEGVTLTDELMYSLSGENSHYGTPVNPKAPGRIPGGSSSGSAVAVAAGLNDFAVGTDTGGSVRIPSSYCGIFGFRPTHGRVSAEGVIPLASTLDTVGWMARRPDILHRVGIAIGAPQENLHRSFRQVYLASDAWDLLNGAARGELAAMLPAVEQTAAPGQWIRLSDKGLQEWADVFRVLQAYEIWRQHGAWITEHRPAFGPGVAERFAWTRTVSREQAEECQIERVRITELLSRLLGEDGLLVIPTAPGGAPKLGAAGAEAEAMRFKIIQLTCIAGLSGFPQVTVPFAEPEGLPAGLSIVAGPGQDGRLLKWLAESLVPALDALKTRR